MEAQNGAGAPAREGRKKAPKEKREKSITLGFDFDRTHEEELLSRKTREMHIKLRRGWWNNPARYFLVLLVASIILSYVYILRLGEGGEVTFLSMLMLCLIGYVIHPAAGLFAAFLYGILRYSFDYILPGHLDVIAAGLFAAFLYGILRYTFDYILPGHLDVIIREYAGNTAAYKGLLTQLQTVGYRASRSSLMLSARVDRVQVIGDLFDYLIGYTLLGLFGYAEALTCRKKDGQVKKVFSFAGAFLAVVLLRYIESVINYVIFYPEPGTFLHQVWEAIGYSFLYVMVEGLLSSIVISVPAVLNMIFFLKTMAGSRFDERIYREY